LKTKSIWITWGCSLGLGALLGAGVLLFILRDQKWAQTIAHEMRLTAQPAREFIIKDQFLIFVPKVPKDFNTILDRLNLEITVPLLTWVLVSKKDHNQQLIVRLDSPEAESDRLILNSLLEHPHILDAQHNFVLEKALVPINNYFEEEWHLDIATSDNPAGLNMPPAWEITQGSSKSVIAVVDEFLLNGAFTFFDRFPNCKDRVSFLNPYAHTGSRLETGSIPHGEIMLLALGACSNEKSYSTGIDWHAKLLATERMNPGQAQSFLAALFVSGIDVCSESKLACPPNIAPFKPGPKPNVLLLPFANNSPDLLQFSSDMIRAIREKNIAVVASAGNNNQDASSFFPGATPGVLNIGASNRHGERASFSNWGPSIALLAPGDSLSFSFPSGRKQAQGTSIAAAFAAGALSLIYAVDPELTEAQARFIVRNSGRPISCESYCAHTPRSSEQASCVDLCCKDYAYKCGTRALNIFDALKQAQTGVILSPVLALSSNYVVLVRNYASPQELSIKNEGDVQAHVEALVYDDNLEILPKQFILGPRTESSSSQLLKLSFKREPFARTIHKIRLVAKVNGYVVDWTDLYVEYVPKK